jgi:exoribonuclease R
MLPKELNADLSSLLQDQPRLAVTLSLDINEQGIVDFSTAKYTLSQLKNTVRLTYKEADKLIICQEEGDEKL